MMAQGQTARQSWSSARSLCDGWLALKGTGAMPGTSGKETCILLGGTMAVFSQGAVFA